MGDMMRRFAMEQLLLHYRQIAVCRNDPPMHPAPVALVEETRHGEKPEEIEP